MNLRGYGTFLFNNDKVNLGRKNYNEALSIDLAENDSNKILKIDTYLMLCDLEKEKEKGNVDEYKLSLAKAMDIFATIKNDLRKNEMQNRIRIKLPNTEEKPNA